MIYNACLQNANWQCIMKMTKTHFAACGGMGDKQKSKWFYREYAKPPQNLETNWFELYFVKSKEIF